MTIGNDASSWLVFRLCWLPFSFDATLIKQALPVTLVGRKAEDVFHLHMVYDQQFVVTVPYKAKEIIMG